MAIGADEDGDARQRTREHQRLVAGNGKIRDDARAVGDDRDAVARRSARVAARQYRRPLAVLEQQPRDVLDDRRLAAAADAKISDTDDRTFQLATALRMLCVPLATPCGSRAVERAERVSHRF